MTEIQSRKNLAYWREQSNWSTATGQIQLFRPKW